MFKCKFKTLDKVSALPFTRDKDVSNHCYVVGNVFGCILRVFIPGLRFSEPPEQVVASLLLLHQVQCVGGFAGGNSIWKTKPRNSRKLKMHSLPHLPTLKIPCQGQSTALRR